MQDNSSPFPSQRTVSRISGQRAADLLLLACLSPHVLLPNLWWRLLGKKLRARSNIEAAIRGLPFAHSRLAHRTGLEDRDVVRDAQAHGSAPSICVHLHLSRSDRDGEVRRAIRSVLRQSIAPVRLLITREQGVRVPFAEHDQVTILPGQPGSRIAGLLAALDTASSLGAGWIVPLAPTARLPSHAIAGYAAHLVRCSNGDSELGNAALLYGDEGEIRRLRPRPRLWLKPQWDPRMALSQDYVSMACAIAVGQAITAAKSAGDALPNSLCELVLRITLPGKVRHVGRVTALTPDGSWRQNGEVMVDAVRRVLGDRAASVSPGPFGTVELEYPLPDPLPKVSVIVATRDRVELLRTCVEGVLHATDYPALELIIADNDSVEPETLHYMANVSRDPRVSVVRWPHPFNYSAINNFAARHASGEYLCLLNNDIEVIRPWWLSAMVREVLQPGVGAVGARLLYPDHSIQHAGVAIGIGNAAGHAHRALPQGEPGYYAQALIARGASAVTGACLLLSRSHFDAVGGLDEDKLAVAYNDVDLCLKLREMGLNNIYTPRATLIHHESKSRGLDFAPEHRERYMRELKVLQQRWDTQNAVDPWHHPGLDRGSETYG